MNTVVLKHQAVSTLVIATHAASVKHCSRGGDSMDWSTQGEAEQHVHFCMELGVSCHNQQQEDREPAFPTYSLAETGANDITGRKKEEQGSHPPCCSLRQSGRGRSGGRALR